MDEHIIAIKLLWRVAQTIYIVKYFLNGKDKEQDQKNPFKKYFYIPNNRK